MATETILQVVYHSIAPSGVATQKFSGINVTRKPDTSEGEQWEMSPITQLRGQPKAGDRMTVINSDDRRTRTISGVEKITNGWLLTCPILPPKS
jgi:hypothetical protein